MNQEEEEEEEKERMHWSGLLRVLGLQGGGASLARLQPLHHRLLLVLHLPAALNAHHQRHHRHYRQQQQQQHLLQRVQFCDQSLRLRA